MRLSVKIFAVLAVLGVVFIMGRVGGWWAGNNGPEPKELTGANAPVSTTNRSNTAGWKLPRPTTTTRLGTASGVKKSPSTHASAPTQAMVSISQPWEQRFDELLTSPAEDSKKALQFVSMMPGLPVEAQIEAAEHAANLLPDDQYAALGALLIDPKTPEPVVDVLITDLLDRPNQLKLPLLLEVARAPNHPASDEAREDLVFFLDEDFGNNWAEWEKTLTAWLHNNKE